MRWLAVLVALLAACSAAEGASPRTVYLPYTAKPAVATATPTTAPTATRTPIPAATSTTEPANIATRTPTSVSTSVPTAIPTSTPSSGGLTMAQAIELMDGYALLYSEEATPVYLGLVSSNCYASDSIINDYGTYGSVYAAKSIRNQYGSYGSPYAGYSAFNDFTSTPPIAWMPSQQGYYAFAYITTNTIKSPRVDSTYLIAYLKAKGGC